MRLVSKLAALRIILEQTGKLKGPTRGVDALAEAMRADQARYAKA